MSARLKVIEGTLRADRAPTGELRPLAAARLKRPCQTTPPVSDPCPVPAAVVLLAGGTIAVPFRYSGEVEAAQIMSRLMR